MTLLAKPKGNMVRIKIHRVQKNIQKARSSFARTVSKTILILTMLGPIAKNHPN